MDAQGVALTMQCESCHMKMSISGKQNRIQWAKVCVCWLTNQTVAAITWATADARFRMTNHKSVARWIVENYLKS